MFRSILLVVSLSLLLFPISLVAQVRTGQSVAEIARQVRSTRSIGNLVGVLRQVEHPVQRSDLDAIADSLVAIATSISPSRNADDLAGTQWRLRIINALISAGREETAGPGRSYNGAGQRLVRIALATNSGGAVGGLVYLADKESARSDMRRVAISSHPLASAAVGFLGRNMGDAGTAILRDLFIRDLVVEPEAKKELAGLASYFGWRK